MQRHEANGKIWVAKGGRGGSPCEGERRSPDEGRRRSLDEGRERSLGEGGGRGTKSKRPLGKGGGHSAMGGSGSWLHHSRMVMT